MLLNSLLDKLKWTKEPCLDVKENSSFSLLMKDRPKIAEVLNGHPSLKRWLAKQFSGKTTRFPIEWNPEEPEVSDIAEHMYPWKGKPANISVSSKISGHDQLSGIIYELFNIRYHKKHLILWKKACKGEIGKQEYNYRSLRLEYKAMKKCRSFLKKYSSAFVIADNSNKEYRKIMSLNSFRDCFAKIQRCDYETHFEKVYDQIIVPHLNNRKSSIKESSIILIDDVNKTT